jgi:hypothetical protein
LGVPSDFEKQNNPFPTLQIIFFLPNIQFLTKKGKFLLKQSAIFYKIADESGHSLSGRKQMAKLVSVTKNSTYKWSLGIRENERDTDNYIEFPIQNAVYNQDRQRFTPRPGKHTFFWGDGDDRVELEWVEILGSEKRNAGSLQYQCRELRFKKPNRPSRDGTPEEYIRKMKIIEETYNDLPHMK